MVYFTALLIVAFCLTHALLLNRGHAWDCCATLTPRAITRKKKCVFFSLQDTCRGDQEAIQCGHGKRRLESQTPGFVCTPLDHYSDCVRCTLVRRTLRHALDKLERKPPGAFVLPSFSKQVNSKRLRPSKIARNF